MSSQAASGLGKFRVPLLVAMMLAVDSLTTLAALLAQDNVAESFAREMRYDFEHQITELHADRQVRLALLAERRRQLVGRSRIIASFEDDAIGYRFTEYTQLKLQYSILEQGSAQDRYNNVFAAQFTLKF